MKNKFTLDCSQFERFMVELDELGADTEKAAEKVLQKAAETVQADVREAMAPGYMPAGGKYSSGETAESILEPKVEWNGTACTVNLGFDYTKSGAGGFLITGTPKMRPNTRLHEIFAEKKYMNQIMKKMGDDALEILVEEMSK